MTYDKDEGWECDISWFNFWNGFNFKPCQCFAYSKYKIYKQNRKKNQILKLTANRNYNI